MGRHTWPDRPRSRSLGAPRLEEITISDTIPQMAPSAGPGLKRRLMLRSNSCVHPARRHPERADSPEGYMCEMMAPPRALSPLDGAPDITSLIVRQGIDYNTLHGRIPPTNKLVPL